VVSRNRNNRSATDSTWLLLAVSLVASLFVASPPVAAQSSDSASRPLAINARVTGSAASGTQQQNAVNLNLSAGNSSADDTKRGADATRGRFEFAYGNGKKPGQDRITTTEMFYGELVESVAITNGPLQKDAQGNDEQGRAPLWLQGVASTYHHIAFGLDHERSFGIGLNYTAQSGFSASADFRHVRQSFAAQSDLSAWGVGLRQTYTFQKGISPAPDRRVVAIGESIEVVPLFNTADPVKARGLLSFTLPLVAGFTWETSFGIDYLSNADPGSKDLYWKFNVGGIGYSFSR